VCLARVLERHVAAFAAHGWGDPALAPGPALFPELTSPARFPSSNTHVAATAPGEYHAVVAAGACKALKEASPCGSTATPPDAPPPLLAALSA